MCQGSGAGRWYSETMIRAVLPGFALAIAVAFAGGAARADTPPEVKQAEALMNEDKDAQAIAILDAYLKTHPNDATALVDRGDAYEDQDKHAKAIENYTAAIAINPSYAYAYASRCQSYEMLDQHKLALTDCDKALELNPKSAYAYRQRAWAKLSLDDTDGANADADEAVKLAPDSALSFGIQCRARWFADNYEGAASACAAALQIDPANYQGMFYSGRIAIHASNWATAESWFSKIIASRPADAGAAYWRAIARRHLQENEGALRDINIYIDQNPDDGDGYMVRARIDYQLHDAAAAKDDGAKALQRYQIDNDTDSIAEAQRFLSDLAAGRDPNA